MTTRARPLIAGIELGGTKCICVLGTGPDDIYAEIRLPTDEPGRTLDAIDAVLHRWRAEHDFDAMGVASFGPLDLDLASKTYGAIVSTPKPGWSGTELLKRARHHGVPVTIDTDVNGAALAEQRWGRAQGLESFAYVTVGTGIGVGTIVSGRPVRGLGHSEAGHQRIARRPGSSWRGVCPYHDDCAEGLASGPAIAANTGRSAEQLPFSDPAWAEVSHSLAMLFHNLVLTTAPQRILLGGGIGSGQPGLLPSIRRDLVESLNGYASGAAVAMDIDSFVVAPGLGVRAGVFGALALGIDGYLAAA